MPEKTQAQETTQGNATETKTQSQTQETETKPEGGLKPSPTDQGVDVEALKAQVRKEVEAEIAKRLKELMGVDSIEELERKVLEEEGKWQELAEKHMKEAENYRRLYEETVKRAEIVSAATRLNAIDPEAVYALVKEQAEVRDGKVFINNKNIETALKEIFSAKPYLVKAGASGSGTHEKSDDKFANVKSYEDLLKDSKLLAEYMKERPEEYKKLREEYFAKKLGA